MARLDARLLLIPLVGLPLVVFALARSAAPAGHSPARQLSTSSNATSADDQKVPPSCPASTLLLNYEDPRPTHPVHEVPIWQFQNSDVFFFTSGMTIDADGAPNAYNPDNTGLDDLANAGSPGHWFGILQDKDGTPVVQGPGDPFPGYYVSCTTLADWSKPLHDPARFVDATQIPYVVLPEDVVQDTGARPGDLAVAVNIWSGDYSYAIFADVGTLGEGSIALANNLGIESDARHGGTWWGVMYLVFPGSGDHTPKTIDEIDREGQQLLQDWGGVAQLNSCAKDAPRPPRSAYPWFWRDAQREPQ